MASQVTSGSTPIDGRFIRAGDLVVVYASRDKTPLPLTIVPGEYLTNAFGHFSHEEMIGLPYGSKILSKNRKGYVYLLRPTPEVWTTALPHRTQILYPADMSFITMKLNLSPGSKVIEAGTGSGSFSHFLGRTIGRGAAVTSNVDPTQADDSARGQVCRNWKGLPNEIQTSSRGRRRTQVENGDEITDGTPAPGVNADGTPMRTSAQIDQQVAENDGRLWSFEFHAGRAEKAKAEFAAHGLDRVAVLTHRNVCRDGFGLTDAADAVFLDLPAPWEAVPFAATALRGNALGRICCFSPCIEQVLKTVAALTEHGFTDIETYESLVKTHESTAAGPEVTVDEALNRIKEVEKRKEARRLLQIEKSRQDKLRKKANAASTASTSAEEGFKSETAAGDASASSSTSAIPEGQVEQGDEDDDDEQMVELEDKKRKRDDDEGDDSEADDDDDSHANEAQLAITKKKARQQQLQQQQTQPFQAASVYSRPYYEMRGHTSYLTFATLLARDMVQLKSEGKEEEVKEQPEPKPVSDQTMLQ